MTNATCKERNRIIRLQDYRFKGKEISRAISPLEYIQRAIAQTHFMHTNFSEKTVDRYVLTLITQQTKQI